MISVSGIQPQPKKCGSQSSKVPQQWNVNGAMVLPVSYISVLYLLLEGEHVEIC